MLTVIDAFTKFAVVKPLRDKSAKYVNKAFESIFEGKRQPRALITDNGAEFNNNELQDILAHYDITHINTRPYHPQANANVEVFNRTIKTMIERYMTHYNTRKYVDILDKLVDNYNSTIHSTTKTKPDEAIANNANHDQIKQNIKNRGTKWVEQANSKLPDDFRQGDYVRHYAESNKEIRRNKTFRKGFHKQWSDEVYCVAYIDYPKESLQPTIFHLMTTDPKPEILENTFFRDQLLKIDIKNLRARPKVDEDTGEKAAAFEEAADEPVDYEAKYEEEPAKPVQ